MTHRLAYAGCLHRFDINEKGYVHIDIYTYDCATERFINAIERPLILSMAMTSTHCTIVGSCPMDKGLLVILHLMTSNSSILMFVQLQSRPWSCRVLHTQAMPSSPMDCSWRCLAVNSQLCLCISDQSNPTGFYRIDHRESTDRRIERIDCSLLSYVYCYLNESYYWLMGNEMDKTNEQQSIKVNLISCQENIVTTNASSEPTNHRSNSNIVKLE
jgi:hypothetical protein